MPLNFLTKGPEERTIDKYKSWKKNKNNEGTFKNMPSGAYIFGGAGLVGAAVLGLMAKNKAEEGLGKFLGFLSFASLASAVALPLYFFFNQVETSTKNKTDEGNQDSSGAVEKGKDVKNIEQDEAVLTDTGKDSEERQKAAENLGSSNNKAARKPLREVVKDDKDENVILKSIGALVKLKDPSCREELEFRLDDSSEKIREASIDAIHSLCKSGNMPGILNKLIERLDKESAEKLKIKIVKTLKDANRKNSTERLNKLLGESKNEELMLETVEALKKFGSMSSALPLIEHGINSNFEKIKIASVDALNSHFSSEENCQRTDIKDIRDKLIEAHNKASDPLKPKINEIIVKLDSYINKPKEKSKEEPSKSPSFAEEQTRNCVQGLIISDSPPEVKSAAAMGLMANLYSVSRSGGFHISGAYQILLDSFGSEDKNIANAVLTGISAIRPRQGSDNKEAFPSELSEDQARELSAFHRILVDILEKHDGEDKPPCNYDLKLANLGKRRIEDLLNSYAKTYIQSDVDDLKNRNAQGFGFENLSSILYFHDEDSDKGLFYKQAIRNTAYAELFKFAIEADPQIPQQAGYQIKASQELAKIKDPPSIYSTTYMPSGYLCSPLYDKRLNPEIRKNLMTAASHNTSDPNVINSMIFAIVQNPEKTNDEENKVRSHAARTLSWMVRENRLSKEHREGCVGLSLSSLLEILDDNPSICELVKDSNEAAQVRSNVLELIGTINMKMQERVILDSSGSLKKPNQVLDKTFNSIQDCLYEPIRTDSGEPDTFIQRAAVRELSRIARGRVTSQKNQAIEELVKTADLSTDKNNLDLKIETLENLSRIDDERVASVIAKTLSEADDGIAIKGIRSLKRSAGEAISRQSSQKDLTEQILLNKDGKQSQEARIGIVHGFQRMADSLGLRISDSMGWTSDKLINLLANPNQNEEASFVRDVSEALAQTVFRTSNDDMESIYAKQRLESILKENSPLRKIISTSELNDQIISNLNEIKDFIDKRLKLDVASV